MEIQLIQLLTTVWYAIGLLLMVVALFVVPRNRKPSSGMAWLLIIFLLPIPGFLLFLLLGSPKLPKSRRDVQARLNQYIAKTLKKVAKRPDVQPVIGAEVSDKYKDIAALATSLTGLPVYSHNNVLPMADYYGVFDSLIEDIDNAKDVIYLEYFILVLDKTTEPIFSALARAVKRGVIVRVLYDAYGSGRRKNHKEMVARLKADGIEAHALLSLRWPGKGYVRPDLRNHRKLVVIDGYVGYTGSQNLISRDYHRKDDIVYDEVVTRLVGPVVTQMEAVFVTDWYSETGKLLSDNHDILLPENRSKKRNIKAQIVPSGPGYVYENNLKIFTAALYSAEKSVTIVNPYFVPDEALITALISAVKRGVRVRMINSEVIDQFFVAHAQRSYYEEMLIAGVDIYLHKAPTLLHSKYMLIDDDLAIVGSSNMDIRSFELSQELTLLVYDELTVFDLEVITDNYLENSKLVNQRKWLARPRYKQLLDNLARLTSSLQ